MDFSAQAIITDTARSLGFLTRLSLPSRYFEDDDGNLSRVSRAFPIAAALAALPPALVLILATWFAMPPMLSALLAIATAIALTGALHEDGLADVADGFFGGKNAEERLDIMKDSRTGVFGVLALLLSVLVRTAAISTLVSAGAGMAAAALIASGAAGRTALVWHWAELPSARPNGTAGRAGRPGRESLRFAAVSAIPLSILPIILIGGAGAAIFCAVAVIATQIAFVRLCREKISGQTGDTLGASAQIGEIAVLIALASAV